MLILTESRLGEPVILPFSLKFFQGLVRLTFALKALSLKVKGSLGNLLSLFCHRPLHGSLGALQSGLGKDHQPTLVNLIVPHFKTIRTYAHWRFEVN
jgi:hypothetical protein